MTDRELQRYVGIGMDFADMPVKWDARQRPYKEAYPEAVVIYFRSVARVLLGDAHD